MNTNLLGKGKAKISIRVLLDKGWSEWMSSKCFIAKVRIGKFQELLAVETREIITLKEAIEKYGYKP